MYLSESEVQWTVTQYFELYFGLSTSNAGQDFNTSRWASQITLKYNAGFFCNACDFYCNACHVIPCHIFLVNLSCNVLQVLSSSTIFIPLCASSYWLQQQDDKKQRKTFNIQQEAGQPQSPHLWHGTEHCCKEGWGWESQQWRCCQV